jgi:hypothetical protein
MQSVNPGRRKKLKRAQHLVGRKQRTEMHYLPFGTLPRAIRTGHVLVHNHVRHAVDTRCGINGFQCSESRRVPEQNMKKSAKRVVDLLEATRPRLIVPMDESCFKLLQAILCANMYQTSADEPFSVKIPIYSSPKRVHRQLFGFRILGNGPLRGSVVIKSPQHPARIFREDYAMACAKPMRKLLESLCADLA